MSEYEKPSQRQWNEEMWKSFQLENRARAKQEGIWSMEEKQEGRFAEAELEMAGVIREGIGEVAKDDIT